MPTMDQAINVYYTVTASPEFREIERLRDKARHDEAQALYHAEQKGIQKGIQQGVQQGIQKGALNRNIEIAKAMIADGESVEKIKRYTGLTSEEIERLRIES